MILFFKKWCESLIVAVFIATIIELLISSSSNKKYIRSVLGVYILFIIISPIININIDDLNFKNNRKYKYEIEVNSSYDKKINDVYLAGLNTSIKMCLEEQGLKIKSVNCIFDKLQDKIEKVEIDVCGSNYDGQDIIDKITSLYEIDKSIICIY